jgi:sporulation protein YlmC with PRC-barrel domain
MDVLYELMDQNLIDSAGERAGRVDDVVVEDVYDRPARILGLLAGGGAKSRHLWAPLHRLSLWLHARLGIPQPVEPIFVPWDRVERVDRDVMLNCRAGDLDLDRMNRAVAERLIGRIPGANG